MIKVIFCDLDDTLLTPKKKDVKITDIEAIRRWLERGNQFVIATARHHTFLNKITDKMEDFDFDYIFGELGVRWLHTGGMKLS